MPDQVLSRLKKATKGLLHPSEYDAPLEPFVWEEADNTTKEVRRLSGQPAKDRCRTLTAEEFFGGLAEVEGFPELYQALRETLSDLKVYRFGGPNVTIYVVGRDEKGRLAGFRTTSVET